MTITVERTTPLVPEIVDDTTRREFIIGGSALAALVLAGCSGDGNDTQDSSASRVVKDHRGVDVNVPSRPERVVVADAASLAFALELGVVPVAIGTVGGSAVPVQLQERFDADLPVPYSRDEPNFELIVQARPDLIIGAFQQIDANRDRFESIAPTVSLYLDLDTAIEEHMLAVGEAIGRVDEAERLLSEHDRRVDELVASTKPAVATATLVYPYEGGAVVYGPGEGLPSYLERFGVEITPNFDGREGATADRTVWTISAELFGELDGEALFAIGTAADAFAQLPLVANLPSVRAGRFHVLAEDALFEAYGLAAFTDAIADVANLLTR